MDHKPVTENSKPSRVATVDGMKGIAILLMVFGHTEQGAAHRHLWDAMPHVTQGINFADSFIYSFHMAVFFFVSGLFLESSVGRRGARSFTITRVQTILYPYLLWSVGGGLIAPLLAPFEMNAGRFSWRGLFAGVLTGNAGWFLITLFVCQILALLVLKFPHWIQMLVAVAGYFLIPASQVTILYRPFLYFPFLVAGMWFSGERMTRLEGVKRPVVWMGFGVLLVLQVTLVALFGPVTRWDMLPIGLLGIAMLLLLCVGIRDTIGESIVTWYGKASLGIFVLAPYFQGLGREFVTRAMHTANPLPYLGVTTIVAATAPGLLWSFQGKLRIGWMFRWPSGQRGPIVPSKPQPVAG